MHNRIKQVRKEYGLNQTEFGSRIGVKQGSVAAYESGSRYPLDSVILSICREFNINENWLRTGEGDPYEPLPTNDIVVMATKLLGQKDPIFEAFIKTYSNLNKADRELIYKIGLDFLKNIEKTDE